MSEAQALAAPVPPATVREAPEVAGYRALWSAAPTDLAARHGIDALEVAGGVCLAVASQDLHPMFCHAFGVGTGRAVTDADLDRMDAFYAAYGVGYQVAAAPSATGDLAARLTARGFRPVRPWMTFHRPAGEIAGPATDLRVVRADAASAPAFGGVVVAGFGMPPDFTGWVARMVDVPGVTCLLAMDGDVPVGAAALAVVGDVAWFSMGAVLAEHRGRGAQGALFAARSRVALRAGARHFVTETGAPTGDEPPGPSYRNMLRWGFREAELRRNLASPPA
ncbi:MAG TPA: GNAT family N-acetyltransferase [Miltoncostaea sp.]|nr:GNAT family N-acetyltransferase [Miltoncostaea sp.]